MSKIDQYIKKRSQKEPKFADSFNQKSQKLQIAVEVRNLRDNLGMTQREFAKLVHKPQSTIARIETGKMSPSIKTLDEIAEATNRQLAIKFIPIAV